MRTRVELSSRAARDLRRLDARARDRIVSLLRDKLSLTALPANLDVVPLQGHAPWLRARWTDYRIIFRPLSAQELATLRAPATKGLLVEQVIHRRDLERAVRSLG